MLSDKFVNLCEAKGRIFSVMFFFSEGEGGGEGSKGGQFSGARISFSRLKVKHRTWLIESTWLEKFSHSSPRSIFFFAIFSVHYIFFFRN